MFHSRDGLFFKRERVSMESSQIVITITNYKKGKILLVDEAGDVFSGYEAKQINLMDTEFASVMASMSNRGETEETYKEALDFLSKQ